MKNLYILVLSLVFLTADAQPINAEYSHESTPLQIALNSMGDDFSQATNFTITQKASAENPTHVVIEIIQTHLLDDSIQSIMTLFSLSKNDSQWNIQKKVVLQQCREGRGHNELNSAPCV